MRVILSVVLLVGCQEYILKEAPPPPPIDPPDLETDIFGDPPGDWDNCYNGFLGLYSNLENDHADVEPEEGHEVAPYGELDWWDTDRRAFQRYDGSLNFGPNWWPVDGGFVDDPAYFAVRWVGWMRVKKKVDHDFIMGASTDAVFLLNDEPLIEIKNASDFDTAIYTYEINTGVYPVDIRYAHRFGNSNGFRFRALSEHLTLCYPDYSTQSSSEP